MAENDFLKQLENLDINKAYSEDWEEIQRRLGWEYPYSSLSTIPAKLSVTELKRRFAAEFSEGE